MRRPGEVWLAGVRFRIEWHQILEDADAGITSDSDRLIKVQTKDSAEPYLRQTLLHEILHASCFAVGGHWPGDEEHCVRMLERPLMSLFDDERNAPLLRWLRRS